MAQSNEAFCMEHLARWCRLHGIHEIRTVLRTASDLAHKKESSEQLALALENQAVLIDAIDAPEICSVKPAAAVAEASEPEAEAEEQSARRTRTAAKK